MNNYEKIKQMTIDEMAEFIRETTNDEYTCSYCADEECSQEFLNRDYDRCDKGIKQWLNNGDNLIR